MLCTFSIVNWHSKVKSANYFEGSSAGKTPAKYALVTTA
jgi:hypothetical protein